MSRTQANGNGHAKPAGFFARVGNALRQFRYDAAQTTTRRKAPPSLLQSEDLELNRADRRALITAAREIRRNFALAGWGIRKHLDYVATFSIRGNTPDRAFNRGLEAWVEKWADPQNFEVSGRHDLYRWLRLAEASRTVDGDGLVVQIADGRVQGIEGDRIQNPLDKAAYGGSTAPRGMLHGVDATPEGRAIRYAVHKRGTVANTFTWERWVPAENAYLHGYFDRWDQIRGVSPLAAAINTFRDAYEALDYALAKAKVTQLFALVTFRQTAAAAGILETEEEVNEDGDTETKYAVDFGAGPIHLDLDPGDDAKFLESASPAAEFQAFMGQTIALALKGLDIPYSFYAENFTNYSGSRQALLQYEQSAEAKRRDNRYLLNRLTRWRLGLAIADGEFRLPAGVSPEQITWEWQPAAVPWIDPLKEIKAETEALGLRVTSRQRICQSRGTDFFDVADELEAEEKYLAERGIPSTVQQPAGPPRPDFPPPDEQDQPGGPAR
jgi:capsid protein